MCTVTFISKSDSDFILTSNRDEAPGRDTFPPEIYLEEGVRLLYPKDAVASGTWIGVSERKRAITLMNGGFVAHDRKSFYRKSRGVVVKDFLKDKLITHEYFMENLYKGFFGINIFPISMCGRIYKKSFLDTLHINHFSFNMGEDLVYDMQVFPEAKSIYFMSDFVYNYRFGGMTSKFNEKIMPAALQMYDYKKEMIKKYNFEKIRPFIIYELKNYLNTYVEMLIRFKPFSEEVSRDLIKELINNEQYGDVIAYYQENKSTDDFVNALIDKNIDSLYSIVNKKLSKKKLSNSVKKIISKILN